MKQYLYTTGPVPMSKEILKIGAEQVPYFRNQTFSELLLETKALLLKLVNAKKGSDVIFLTGSGTAAMEASVMNLLNKKDKAIVINGGGFGQRFVDLCKLHQIPNKAINLAINDDIDFKLLKKIKATAFLVNAHETSIGKLYDLKKIGQFCKQQNLLNIVDAISAFVCDEVDMKKQAIDALILSSNKGLALPPGLAMVVLSPRAQKHINPVSSMYFDFDSYRQNMVRGQTPFTPAISIVKQLHYQLSMLEKKGIKQSVQEKQAVSSYFRDKIKPFPLKPFLSNMSNAMTPVTPTDGQKASRLIEHFEKHYNIILTPIGGVLKDKLIRVSHMGEIDEAYMDVLIKRFKQYYR